MNLRPPRVALAEWVPSGRGVSSIFAAKKFGSFVARPCPRALWVVGADPQVLKEICACNISLEKVFLLSRIIASVHLTQLSRGDGGLSGWAQSCLVVSVCHGGQIGVSQAVCDAVGGQFPGARSHEQWGGQILGLCGFPLIWIRSCFGVSGRPNHEYGTSTEWQLASRQGKSSFWF